MIPSSISRVFSGALTCFPRVLSICVCLGTSTSSVISEIWSLLILIFGVKFYYLQYGPYVWYHLRQLSVVLHISLPMIFFWFRFSKIVYGYWKFSLTGFTGLLFGDLCDAQHGVFLFLAIIIWSFSSTFLFGPHILVSVSVVLKHSMLPCRIGNSCCRWFDLLNLFSIWSPDVVRMGSL